MRSCSHVLIKLEKHIHINENDTTCGQDCSFPGQSVQIGPVFVYSKIKVGYMHNVGFELRSPFNKVTVSLYMGLST